jgi:hypothetical protein
MPEPAHMPATPSTWQATMTFYMKLLGVRAK